MLNLKDIATGIAQLKTVNERIVNGNHFGLELITQSFNAHPEDYDDPYVLQTRWYVHNARGRKLLVDNYPGAYDLPTDYPFLVDIQSFIKGNAFVTYKSEGEAFDIYKAFFDNQYALPETVPVSDELKQLRGLILLETGVRVGQLLVGKPLTSEELVRTTWPVDKIVKVEGKGLLIARTEDGAMYLLFENMAD